MSARSTARLTRRAVLAGAAGAGAASLLEPVAGLAQSLGARPSVFSLWVGSLVGDSAQLQAARRFELVGVEWTAPSAARIELRARARGGGWSGWVPASTLGHGPDRGVAGRALFGEAIWTGRADYVQLRATRPLRGVRLHFVTGRGGPGAASVAAARPLAVPALDAGPGQPPIIARAAWAHRQAPHAPPAYGTVKLAFVHHTVNPNGYSAGEVPAMLLAIFDYHRYVRGFNDIAYNFIIDVFGRIWEARAGGIDEAVIGAQAGGYNLESTGVAVLGTFSSVVPPPAAIAALERLLAWKLSLHGLPTLGHVTVEVNPAAVFYTPFRPGAHVSLPRIAGHRDGDLTACPGNAFYTRLPTIRRRAAVLAGTPARVTLAPEQATVIAGASINVSGQLTAVSGGPLPGAPIEVQQLTVAGEPTIAQSTTGADGAWTTAVQLSFNEDLRALHRPAPATVSDLARVGVAPAITLNVDSPSPLRVSGAVFPNKRSVTIDAYLLQNGHRQLVTSKRVAVVRGHFRAKLALRRRGRYVLRARSAPDARNVAGASPTVTITV
jgi:N-acetylmuramoyl-L-alanine amidase